MGNVGNRFLISLFTLCLWFIVFVNYAGWSGLNMNGFAGFTDVTWPEDSYFGFSSLLTMIKTFKITMDNSSIKSALWGGHNLFSAEGIFYCVGRCINYFAGNLPSMLTKAFNLWDAINNATALSSISWSNDVMENIAIFVKTYIDLFRNFFVYVLSALGFLFAPFILLFYMLLTFVSTFGFIAGFIVNFIGTMSGKFNIVRQEIPNLWNWDDITDNWMTQWNW